MYQQATTIPIGIITSNIFSRIYILIVTICILNGYCNFLSLFIRAKARGITYYNDYTVRTMGHYWNKIK